MKWPLEKRGESSGQRKQPRLPRARSATRQRLKRALAKRDGRCCFYCGTPFNQRFHGATLDHLVPLSRVPTWVQAALVLACEPCNQAKADTLPQALLRPPAGRFGPGLVLLEAPGAQVALVVAESVAA